VTVLDQIMALYGAHEGIRQAQESLQRYEGAYGVSFTSTRLRTALVQVAEIQTALRREAIASAPTEELTEAHDVMSDIADPPPVLRDC
jgi:hypothetical protein